MVFDIQIVYINRKLELLRVIQIQEKEVQEVRDK